MKILFKYLYDFEKRQINSYYTANLLLRSLIVFVALYFTISAIYYAKLANINFGIISCCFIFSIVVNIACGYLFFQEKINSKVYGGIFVTLAGIIWISLDKGSSATQLSDIDLKIQDDSDYYKTLSVIYAIGVGCVNASMTVQAKFINKKLSLDLMNFASDSSLLFSLIYSIFSLYFFLIGHESISQMNFNILLVSSILMTLCSFVGTNCSVKGLAGPTIAIIYTQCFFTTALQVIFLGMIPTLAQLAATLVAFTGILIIIYYR